MTHEIDAISDNIRQKYRALKHDIRESDEALTRKYKPLLEPLTQISEKLNDSSDKIKKKIKVEDEDTKAAVETKTPSQPRFLRTEVLAQTPDVETPNVTLEEFLATPEGRHEAQEYVEQSVEGPLARKYLLLALSDDRDKKMDHTYGVRNVVDKWMVGNSVLEINQDDSFYIAGKRYRGTPGLYELMFMKEPDKSVYDENDLAAYKSILSDTNAYKRYYLPGAKVNTNKGLKYREIIARLFPPRSGRGIDYVHWNDPNELVERLRLLVSSKRVGHTGHDNEIISVVEELREANIIVYIL